MRAGAPLEFPTETVAVSTLLPDFDRYAGPPIEFGRMEPTASDPDVQQQYGMTVGTPNSGQINALGTLNLRGERSVTCKGDRDRHPSAGPLAGRVARRLRRVPQAAGRARARRRARQAVRHATPDLAALPMYCIPFSFKDPFDTMDMRTTAAADARYDIDFPGARPHARRPAAAEGRHHLRQGGEHGIQRHSRRPGRTPRAREQMLVSDLGYQRSSWGGNPHSAYDSTRAASLGSSSGSGASVSANLVMCSICEETSMSCRGPANHNSVALILPHKAMVSFLGGAIGADIHNDRSGIHCRSVTDSAKVLDALKDPVNGYYDPRDVFTTVPRAERRSNVVRRERGRARDRRVAQGRAHRRHPRIDADVSRASRRTSRSPRRPRRRSRTSSARIWARRWSSRPIRCGRTIRQIENMTTSYTRALAELVPSSFPTCSTG